MLCFYRWSAQGKFFGRLGEDSISIYETPVSCHPVYSPKNRSLCGNIFLLLLSGSYHFEIIIVAREKCLVTGEYCPCLTSPSTSLQ